MGTLHGIFSIAYLEQRFHHILLHIGACVLLRAQELADDRVLVGIGYTADDGQCLHPVVGIAGIGRMAICLASPAGIVSALHLHHLLAEA